MDMLRTEVLEEMLRNGRVYSKEEVKKAAWELLERRRGKDPLALENLIITVPRDQLDEVTPASVALRTLVVGEWMVARWDGGLSYQYYIIYRLPNR